MRAAAYLRVSTRQQDWESQKVTLERVAASRGDEIVEWFDEKRSGKSSKRPELERLRAAARAGAVTRVYVFQLSRFSRRGVRDMHVLVGELFDLGVTVINPGDPFDVSRPGMMRDFAISVMAMCAEIEWQTISERISAARTKVETSGGRWGRPKKVDAVTLAAARKMQREGLPLRTIAARLKVKKATLHRALKG